LVEQIGLLLDVFREPSDHGGAVPGGAENERVAPPCPAVDANVQPFGLRPRDERVVRPHVRNDRFTSFDLRAALPL